MATDVSPFGIFQKKEAFRRAVRWHANEMLCGLVGRQFSGHQDRVTAVQYHPSKGYYLVSGSADSVVKIWDVRRKSCLLSFKGHNKQVTQCSFSPDGKWICAGFGDGEVKLWDIGSRSLLKTFREHRGRITGIEFHPEECLMATSSSDGSVRLWDLENSETIEKIGPEKTEVRCIQFSAHGDCLLSAIPDGLRSHGWEPYQLHDSVSIPWSHIRDMSIWHMHKKLVACTMNQTRVAVWLVDLKKIRPFAPQDPPPHKEEEQPKKRGKGETIPALKIDPILEMRDSDSSARTTTSGRYSEKYSAIGTERSGMGPFSREPSVDSERVRGKPSTDRASSKASSRTSLALDLSDVQRPCHGSSSTADQPSVPPPVPQTPYPQSPFHERCPFASLPFLSLFCLGRQ